MPGTSSLCPPNRVNPINASEFGVAAQIDELNLVANTVKHGDGRSAEELRSRKPKLFQANHSDFPNLKLPLRPLVGEGLCLTSGDFKDYHACLETFWKELTDVLLPIFCPPG